MEQDLFEKYLNEKNCKYIKIALTDSSYNTARSKGVKKNNPNYEELHKPLSTNRDLATIGDALMKLIYAKHFYEDEKTNKLSKKIEQYITDKYLVSVVAKHYDILKYLQFDKDNKSMKADYKYENRTRTEGKNKKNNPRKYIATAIEAMIGTIYMEANGNNIKEISDLLTKCWINFN